MTDVSRLVFNQSPLFPRFDQDTLVALALHDITVTGIAPAPAIALVTHKLMASHILLLGQQPETLAFLRTGAEDLLTLDLGFQFPLQTIMASATCLPHPESDWPEIFETLVLPTHNFNNLRAQEQMCADLRATINLLKLDPSGAHIFDFLRRYPLINDEYFFAGHEIAAMIFFGISIKVDSLLLPDKKWLDSPTGPNDLSITE